MLNGVNKWRGGVVEILRCRYRETSGSGAILLEKENRRGNLKLYLKIYSEEQQLRWEDEV